MEGRTNSRKKRTYTEEEKRAHCEAYEQSEMTKAEFCKKQGISRTALRQWSKQRSEKGGSDFFQARIKGASNHLSRQEDIEVRVLLPGQVEVFIAVKEKSLLRLIEGLCHATAIIR